MVVSTFPAVSFFSDIVRVPVPKETEVRPILLETLLTSRFRKLEAVFWKQDKYLQLQT